MNGNGVAEWTRQINAHGFSFVKGCPKDPQATKKLLEKIGPIRETHYGKEVGNIAQRKADDSFRWILRLHGQHGFER